MGVTRLDLLYSQAVIVNEETFFQMYLAGQIPDKSMRDANGRRIVIDMNQFMAVEAEGPLS